MSRKRYRRDAENAEFRREKRSATHVLLRARTIFRVLTLICLIVSFHSPGQERRGGESDDMRHSVFGPPRPAFWEFQISRMSQGTEDVSSFNFYRKDQRNKTLFFKLSDNSLNNRNEFRVQEVTAGALLFPVNDDDRYELDIGGTYDRLKDTTLPGRALYSRATYRPQPALWFRIGYEYFDGYTSGRPGTYRKTVLNTSYLVGKTTINFFSLVGLIGNGKVDDALNARFGLAGIVTAPFNSYAMFGYMKSDEPKENVRTLALGRWAPFRPDGLPSGMFIWKHRENYDFELGGVFWGKYNLFVQPAAIGMSQGIFISSAALRENSELRQGQLMSITDDYRNSNVTLFYVYLSQGIEMIPGNVSHVGFRAIQLYKIFDEVTMSMISKPVLGLFYNEETEPEFKPALRKFVDKESTFWSYQAGVTIQERFILNVIHSPKTSEWTAALSFVYAMI